MWDPAPYQGLNPGPLQWKHGVLTTGPLGNSQKSFDREHCVSFFFLSPLCSTTNVKCAYIYDCICILYDCVYIHSIFHSFKCIRDANKRDRILVSTFFFPSYEQKGFLFVLCMVSRVTLRKLPLPFYIKIPCKTSFV